MTKTSLARISPGGLDCSTKVGQGIGDLHVRALERQDVTAVIELSRQLARHVEDPEPKLSPETLKPLAYGPHPWFEALVLERDDKIVGFAAFTQGFELHTNSRVLFVTDFIVDDRVRKIGLGLCLMKALRVEATARHCSAIKLEVWKQNAQAQEFYTRQGAEFLHNVELRRISL